MHMILAANGGPGGPYVPVMDTGISILIYITYVYLYCLQLPLVTLYSVFIGSDHFMIIE